MVVVVVLQVLDILRKEEIMGEVALAAFQAAVVELVEVHILHPMAVVPVVQV
jgi:hypothetical protein